jgi:ADP-heptose:LPS heptosyltransferase
VRRLMRQIVSHVGRIMVPKSVYFLRRWVIRRKRNESAERKFTFLVIKLDRIGDAILAVPAMRDLRRSFPESRILLVVRPLVGQLMKVCPYVDRVILFDLDGPRLLRPITMTARLARIGWTLAKERIDSAIVLRWDTDSLGCGIAYMSGAPVRVGYSENVNPSKAKANRGNDALLTDVLDDRSPGHEVASALSLIERVGARTGSSDLELWLTAQDKSQANGLLLRRPLRSDALVGVSVGASERKRQWPIARYIVVCKTLRKMGLAVVLLGSAQEAEAARAVEGALGEGVINLAGCTSLRETAAVLARCLLIVGNDSGLVHIAAAVSVPSVVISCHPRTGDPLHPNAPDRFAPWGVRTVVCQPPTAISPCVAGCDAKDAHCILGIEPHEVVDSALQLLGVAQDRTFLARREDPASERITTVQKRLAEC